jgi:hypothetical protein
MSCPFYGVSLVAISHDRVGSGQLVAMEESNRCALIVSAHSPCWMEVGEHVEPYWGECWRNPEYVVRQAATGQGLLRRKRLRNDGWHGRSPAASETRKKNKEDRVWRDSET